MVARIRDRDARSPALGSRRRFRGPALDDGNAAGAGGPRATPRLAVVNASVVRVFSLLLAGSLGVHELRYRLAFGADAGQQLAHEGHGYLSVVTFAAGPMLALVFALWLVRVAGSPSGAATRRSGPKVAWLSAGSALCALYGMQELLEGALAGGHPGGVEGVVASGGWLAFPLSYVFGGIVALGLRVARSIETRR